MSADIGALHNDLHMVIVIGMGFKILRFVAEILKLVLYVQQIAPMLFAALIVQLHNINSTHILSFKTLASVAELAGLNLNRSQTPKDVFSRDMAQLAFHFLNYYSTDTENSGINMFFT